MLKISAVYLIGKAEIPIHYTTWSQVEQALLSCDLQIMYIKKLVSNAMKTFCGIHWHRGNSRTPKYGSV